MHTNPRRVEILEALCELGSRYQFDGRLSFIAPDENAYRSPADPSQAISVLDQRFGALVLLEAGVAVRSGEGELQLSPLIARPNTAFIVLRSGEDRQPYALMTSEGCLGQDSPPLFAALDDRHTLSCLKKSDTGCVYVCATIEDVILLRSLGSAATTAAGLTKLTFEDIRTLDRRFGFGFMDKDDDEDREDEETAVGVAPTADPPGFDSSRIAWQEIEDEGPSLEVTGADEEDELEELGIVFVAWSPSRLEPGMASCIASVEESFKTLNQNFEMSLNPTTWLPTDADIAQMEFVIARKSKKWLRKKMVSSLETSYYKPLKGKMPQAPTPPVDYADAVGRLLGPRVEDETVIPSPDKPHKPWLVAQQLLERDVIRPITEQAMRAPDCIEGTLTLGLAQLSRLFHTQGLFLGKKLSEAVATKGVDGLTQVPKEAIDQVISLADRMQKMASEIYRWRESAIVGSVECRMISQPSSPRLLNSD